MGKRFNILLVVFCVAILYAIYYFALPLIFNLNKLNPYICNYIKHEYGYNIVMTNPSLKMSYSPAFWLKADNFEILNDDKSKALVIQKPVIKISIFPLLIGRVYVKYFSSEKIFADFYCDNKLRLSLGQYILLKRSDSIINFDNIRTYNNKFYLILNDKFKKNKTVISGQFFNINKYSRNKYLKASTVFSIMSEHQTSNVNLSLDTKLPFIPNLSKKAPKLSFSVTNLLLSEFSNYINYFSNGDITDITGLVNLEVHSGIEKNHKTDYFSNFVLDNFSVNTTAFQKKYNYSDKIRVSGMYTLVNDALNFDNFQILTDKFSVDILGKINKISSDKPKPDMSIKILNTKAQDLLKLIPYCSELDENLNISLTEIKDAELFSDVSVNINIKDSFKEPLMYGDIKMLNTYIGRPIVNAPKNADVDVNFKGDTVKFDVHVPTDVNQYVDVNGECKIHKDHYADIKIKSTDKINLAEAERILMPVHKAFNFMLGPVPVMAFSGYGNIDLNVKGNKKNPRAFGVFKTLAASTNFDDIPNFVLSNAESILEFDDKNTKFELIEGYVNGKKIGIKGVCDLNGKFNFDTKISGQNANYLLTALKTSKMLTDFNKITEFINDVNGNADLNMNINGEIKDISELKLGKNVHFKGELALYSVKSKILNLSKKILPVNGKVKFNDFDMNLNFTSYIGHSKILISGNLSDDKANISFNTDKIFINDIIKTFILPFEIQNTKNRDSSYLQLKGKYSGPIEKPDLKNFITEGLVSLKNGSYVYKPLNMPVNISNSQIFVNNNKLTIKRTPLQLGTMSAVIGGNINNIFEKPYFDISIFSRPNQKFLDYVYNSSAIYPIKIKGNASFSGLISGNIDKLNVNSSIKLDKNSNIYYMGASIGSSSDPINLTLNSTIEPKRLNLKLFNIEKAGVKNLSASGTITNNFDNTAFSNFKINTYVPTDMKIFNILFKKPFIKKGYFTSTLLLNGTSKEPVIRGNLNLFDMDIPFIDSTIQNVSLKFLPDNISASLTGTVLNNKFTLNVSALNKLKPPYVVTQGKLIAGELNLDKVFETITGYEVAQIDYNNSDKKSNSFNFNDYYVKNFIVSADGVYVNKTQAKNLYADISLKNGNIKVDPFKFKMAKGNMEGSVSHNTKNRKSEFNLLVTGADADTLSTSLVDLKGQLFGDVDGQLKFTCIGDNQEKCLKTLDGKVDFIIKEGRMPKLGSLEYLLKAGNLVKSGLTGLSVNSILNLVSPLKTGSFDSIRGAITIEKGIAEKIQILSNSKDLNLFITGTYDLSSKYADMYVFGRLARKFSAGLGPVGNLSINTLFNTIPGVNLSTSQDTKLLNGINKIPGLELSNKAFRVFAAEIHGDISGEDYVESFKWIE